MKNQSGGPLVLSPELWAGVVTDYDKNFVEKLKKLCDCMAWDRQSKTWWFPISYLPFVKQLVRESGLVADGVLDAHHQMIQAELNRRTMLKVNTSVDGEVAGALADAYALLGLHPSCPRTLVEWAIILARKEGAMLGAPTTELLKKEEAYRLICGQGSVQR